MPSFTQLTELAELLTNRRDAWSRAKYLRAAGILGRSSMDPEAPDVDAVHAAAMLIACAWPGTQFDAADATRRLWGVSAVQHKHDAVRSELRFGPQLVGMINFAAGSRCDDQDLLANLQSVTIRRDITLAAINYVGFPRFFGDLDSAARDDVKLVTVTVIPPSTLKKLGQLVARSRMEAARRGVTIEVAGAYRALGDEPPPRQRAPLHFSELSSAENCERADSIDKPVPGTADSGSGAHRFKAASVSGSTQHGV